MKHRPLTSLALRHPCKSATFHFTWPPTIGLPSPQWYWQEVKCLQEFLYGPTLYHTDRRFTAWTDALPYKPTFSTFSWRFIGRSFILSVSVYLIISADDSDSFCSTQHLVPGPCTILTPASGCGCSPQGHLCWPSITCTSRPSSALLETWAYSFPGPRFSSPFPFCLHFVFPFVSLLDFLYQIRVHSLSI